MSTLLDCIARGFPQGRDEARDDAVLIVRWLCAGRAIGEAGAREAFVTRRRDRVCLVLVEKDVIGVPVERVAPAIVDGRPVLTAEVRALIATTAEPRRALDGEQPGAARIGDA